MPGPLRNDERDAPPVCGRPPGVGCPVREDHLALALASLSIGLGGRWACWRRRNHRSITPFLPKFTSTPARRRLKRNWGFCDPDIATAREWKPTK